MEPTAAPQSKRAFFLLLAVAVVTVMLGLLVLIAVSPIPMRGAELFGKLANKIKGNPGATAYWTLFAGSMLWVIIGLIVAVQEWSRDRRLRPLSDAHAQRYERSTVQRERKEAKPTEN